MLDKIYGLVNNTQLYNHLRFSGLSNVIFELLTNKTKKTETYFRDIIGNESAKGNIAFDIGANKGNKVAALLRMGFSVYAIEPEKMSLDTLKYRYKNNKEVTILPVGISNQPGKLTMYIYAYRSGYNTLSEASTGKSYSNKEEKLKVKETYKVDVTTLDALVKKYGKPYFIKIDVEGFEKNVIEGLSEKIPYISFEANLPDFINETRQIIDKLLQIEPATLFAISENEQLKFNGWKSGTATKQMLDEAGKVCWEIIAKTV